MLKRLLLVILLLAIVAVGASELVLPGLVSKELSSNLQETFGTGDAMHIKLRSFPALRMLTGHLDQINVVSSNVPAGSLNLDTLSVTMTDVSVNMRDLLAHKGLAIKHAAGAKVVITISEASFQRYLLEGVEGLGDPRVLINDRMEISGYITVAGIKTLVTFGGSFALKDDNWVSFTVSQVKVGDVEMPESFVSTFLGLLGAPELGLDLGKFPLPLKGTAVRQEQGQLVIEAESP